MTVIFNQAKEVELIVTHAEQLAQKLAVANRADRVNDETCKTQLRKFYQEFNSIRNYVISQPDQDEAYNKRLITLKMLIAKAEYAKGRKVKTLPVLFIDWFIDNIKAIHTPQDVETFGNYFEALIGFFYSANANSNSQQGPRPNNFNNQNRR